MIENRQNKTQKTLIIGMKLILIEIQIVAIFK